MNLLIVNADDYGLAPSVSRGILKAFMDGIVSSTTVMANIATPDELAWLKEGMLPFGVHVNLNRGWPLTEGAPGSLVGVRGEFRDTNFRTDGSSDGLADAELTWIAGEIAVQVERVEREAGKPTHLDSHHHIHRNNKILDVLVRVAEKRGIGIRPCEPSQVGVLRAKGIPCPDAFSDAFFGRANVSVGKLAEIINGADRRSLEIMCHPGFLSGSLKSRSSYVSQREEELETLTSEEALLLVESSKYLLGGYAQLGRN
jgi:hypothetical protein